MWNDLTTDSHSGLLAEVISYAAGNGDMLHAYWARPMGDGPYPSIVLVHHLPGWDELYREFARRFANQGYAVLCPDLYCRVGHGSPDDIAARVRSDGGLADAAVVADLRAAMTWLRSQPTSNGKVGGGGAGAGGRRAY